ncbi:MAG: hypothetical protein RBU45_26625, partial [Myxococcota bacterium]|nr:hypothetical protein [Myxococcota bacterium]
MRRSTFELGGRGWLRVALLLLATGTLACAPETTDLAKTGGVDALPEFQTAEQFSAIRADASSLCLSGEVTLRFTEPGQQIGYAFAARQGQSFEAQTLGDPEMDTLLLLYGPDDGTGYFGRSPILADDDGGDGVLSRIQDYSFKETGVFLLIATTYQGEYQGAVTLTVALGGGPGCTTELPDPATVCCGLMAPDGSVSFVYLTEERCVANDGLPLEDDGRCAGEGEGEGEGGEGEGEGGEGEGEGEGAWPTVCCALTAADGTMSFVFLTEERCVANDGLPLQDDGRCAGEGEGEGEG